MTDQESEFARLRSYLLSQGERNSFLNMWPRRMKARLEVLDVLEGVTEEQARFKPDENEWSTSEVALHVLNGSRRVAQLVELLAQGEAASSARTDPPREGTERTIAELRDMLLIDGLDWSAVTQRLPETPSFTATAPHSMFGDLHSRAWYLFQRVHDLDHARQIQANKELPGYPAAQS